MPSPASRTVNLPAFAFDAELIQRAAAAADDARIVDLTFTTGAGVMRRDWYTGEKYLEKLSLDPQHVRLGRLNRGAPLLNSHNSYSLEDQLGVVEDNTAVVDGKRGKASVRFSNRASVDDVWRDVQDKIVRNVSVGYAVYAYDETPPKKTGGIPTRTAVDWEPFELSLVTMPADAGAQTRDARAVTFPCCITVRAADAEESNMPAETTTTTNEPSETLVERNPLDVPAPLATPVTETRQEPTDTEIAATRERERVQGIMAACRASRMTTEFQDRLINEGVALVAAQTRVFDEMRKRGADSAGPQTSATPARVAGGEDALVHVRAGIENALLHRLAGDLRKKDGSRHFELTTAGRDYRGMSLMDIARAYLQCRGMRVTTMPRMELASVALGLSERGGMHTTSDFANLLADVANKTLRAAYEEQPQTFRPLVRVVTVPDFKVVNRVQLGDAPALLEILEDGEYKAGTVSDGKETYQLASYGRKFAITRKALVNDDVDAFSRVPMMFGRKARVLESNLVWAQITGNPVMADGNNLFSVAHGNLAADGDHIAIASLSRGRAAMRQQTSLDGEYLNLSAVAILVPTGLETKAQQFTSQIVPNASGSVNPFTGLSVIAEPRLDANSATAWYLVAPVNAVDIIELAYLEGDEGPRVESRVGFDIDGLEVKCGMDVAAKVIDFRGLYKDPGDLDS